jgi:hypothetical protein
MRIFSHIKDISHNFTNKKSWKKWFETESTHASTHPIPPLHACTTTSLYLKPKYWNKYRCHSLDWCGLGIKPDNIIYFHFLHKGGRLKLVCTIGHVLYVLLFLNGFMPSMLIAILIFLGSLANLGYHESMFCHYVASVGCLISSASCLCFSLCHRNNSDSFLCDVTALNKDD